MARSSKSFKSSKPSTPVQKRFLRFGLFEPRSTLGKRHRDRSQDNSDLDPVIETPPQNSQAHKHAHNTLSAITVVPPLFQAHKSPKPACMALQNEDQTEDVVIITALDTIPFCCHEDLLTMSREQLIAAARSLNAKLPAALHINVSHSDAFIRNSIELLVGLRQNVPAAPKAVRSRSNEESYLTENFEDQLNINRSPPTSPLSRLSRSYDTRPSLSSPRLAKLEEEEEEPVVADRPVKKRKFSSLMLEEDDSSPHALEKDMSLTFTPTPLPRRSILRSRSHNVTHNDSPTPIRILRSRSHRLPEEMKGIQVDAILTMTSKSKYRNDKDETTSAPTSRQTRSASLRMKNLTPQPNEPTLSRGSTSIQSAREKSAREVSLDWDQDTALDSSVDDREMISGIDGMTMGVSLPDIDDYI